MTEDPVTRMLADSPEPQPGPKWLAMTSRQRRQWEHKQWTDPDLDYDGPPLIQPPTSRSRGWFWEKAAGLLSLLIGVPVILPKVCAVVGAALLLYHGLWKPIAWGVDLYLACAFWLGFLDMLSLPLAALGGYLKETRRLIGVCCRLLARGALAAGNRDDYRFWRISLVC